MIMGPFGLNGFILDISGDILFGWLIFHPTALSGFFYCMKKRGSIDKSKSNDLLS